MKKLRITIDANIGDNDPLALLLARYHFMKTVDSNMTAAGGASPVIYHAMTRPNITVMPDWWTEADLAAYADKMTPIVLELEDDEHDSIIAQLDSRSVIDTTSAGYNA